MKKWSSWPVRRLNSLSASALNVALTATVDIFPTLAATFLAGTGAESDAEEATGTFALFGAGDAVRLGSALMVRSLPWVSIMAAGNSANFASNAVGRRDLATRNRASTAGEVGVESFQ